MVLIILLYMFRTDFVKELNAFPSSFLISFFNDHPEIEEHELHFFCSTMF